MWRTARTLSGRTRPYRLLRLLPEDVRRSHGGSGCKSPPSTIRCCCAPTISAVPPPKAGLTSPESSSTDPEYCYWCLPGGGLSPGFGGGPDHYCRPDTRPGLAEGIGAALADRDVQPVVDIAEAFEGFGWPAHGVPLDAADGSAASSRSSRSRWQPASRRTGLPSERSFDTWQRPTPPAWRFRRNCLNRCFRPRPHSRLRCTEPRAPRRRGQRKPLVWACTSFAPGVARDYLHQFPPPAAATTVRRLVEHLSVDDASRIIEVYAR